MKFIATILSTLLISQAALALECTAKNKKYQVTECKINKLCATDGNRKIELSQDISAGDKTECKDVNFDGYQDIIVSHPPSGQVQFSSVFLYDKSKDEYVKNDKISNLPCLQVDKSRRIVSGTCFSSSNCDKWIEQYKYQSNGELQLSLIKGIYCEPSTGNAFSYIETYKNGRIFKKKVKRLNDQ